MCYFRSFHLSFGLLVIYRTKIYRTQDCARSSDCTAMNGELDRMCKKAPWAKFKTQSATLREGTAKKPRKISVRIVGVPSEIRARYLDSTDLLGRHATGKKVTGP
jgi:hypothetical protein